MSKSFKTYLNAELRRIAKRENLPEHKAFLFWFAVIVLELTEDDAREAISVEGANDKGADLFWVDDEEGRVIIAQGKHSPAFNFRAKVSHVTALESSLNWLANPEALRRDGKAGTPAQSAEDYIKATQDGYGVELWCVYTGPKCPNVEKHIGVYNQNPDNMAKRRAMRHYHVDMLRASWEELEGSARRITSDKVTTVGPGALTVDGAFGKALVATVPASEIVGLYEKYEERLFDRNVRLFLGVRKGSVNAGIAETLGDVAQRGHFWAYNNGLTFICDDYDISGTTITLRNFSIVNGCQTAVSLAQKTKSDLANVSVLARFIAASAGIVDDIIRFTNSQNPIRTWDIASQDRTQRRLKTEFGRLQRPYIYLTRRGARPKGDLRAFRENGRLRQIRIDIMGQYAAAFRGDPVLAYKHKAFIFSRHHDTVFPPDVRVEEVLFQWLCGEASRQAVQEAMSNKKEDEIRILKKGGTLFVLAVVSRILHLRNGATYLKTIDEPRIISKESRKRLQRYAQYAVDAYVQAVLDQAEVEQQELPTLIRSREFHQKVMDRVGRAYRTAARAAKWLSEALPKIQ